MRSNVSEGGSMAKERLYSAEEDFLEITEEL
jgi:hypothetical protein